MPYEKNPRQLTDKQYKDLEDSLKKFDLVEIPAINTDNTILAGHQRLRIMQALGRGDEEIDVRVPGRQLTEKEVQEYNIRSNKNTGEWDFDLLANQFEVDDLLEWGFDEKDLKIEQEIEEDEVPQVSDEPAISKLGEVYQLGRHRLMCGDATKIEDVEKLVNGQKADMVFTDPPYGMKKENEGVLNDNLNYEDLLEFNKEWIPLSFSHLKENGSWYCWGTDEPLMDIYAFIIKPYIKENKVTFRNLITWDKGNGQGQNSEKHRMYAIADEKLLFCMTGVQGFNTNQDNYYEAWEPIRLYLEGEKKKLGWSDKWIAEKLNIDPRLHWFSKSQWEMPTEEKYKALRELANNDAFKRDYDEIKRDYYATRAYFDNTHDNMNNVWRFKRDVQNTEHATPKPIELCVRAIKTSSRENELCFDLFGGSGSTLIACEQTNRTCYCSEIDPKYCDVIRKRYAKFIGKEDKWQEITPVV